MYNQSQAREALQDALDHINRLSALCGAINLGHEERAEAKRFWVRVMREIDIKDIPGGFTPPWWQENDGTMVSAALAEGE